MSGGTAKKEKVVCVTGASGYIASWLVKLLLQRGYTAKASVRDPKLMVPAVKGTLNVLRSCVKVPSIKRVVITFSVAAVVFNGKPLTPDVLVDESWFSDAFFCEKSKFFDDSVASEIRSKFDELKSEVEKERQNFAKAVSKSSKECENCLKNETAKFQEVYEKFCKKKSAICRL